jgi:molybdopterin-guanine dinucleotide biosynthesis protein B
MKVYTIAGWSNSGKTTLIINLIKEFKKRGLKVLALKNVHDKYNLEPETKDSSRFLKAGADTVYLSAKNELMKIEAVSDSDKLLKILESEFKKYDIVLLEGLKMKNYPVIEIYNSKNTKELKNSEEKLYAIISDIKISESTSYYNINDISGISKFLI